jgi:hypothetical protein
MTPALIPSRVAVLVAFAIVGLLNASFVLNHFLVYGAPLLDGGLFAGMLERRGGMSFSFPYAISGSGETGFWATHFSPTLLLVPAFQAVTHSPPIPSLALVLGLTYGLLALSICWLLVLQTPASARNAALCLAGTLAFLACRPILAAVTYPHFEFLFVSLVLLFGIAFFHGRTAIALLLLTLAIGVREDCGFHFFAVAATYLVLIRLVRPLTRAEWQLAWFALYAFCWSVLALAAQRAFFPGDNALARIYLGEPALAHVTTTFIGERASAFVTERFDIILMWGWLIGLAAITRTLTPLAGVLAFLPWTVLNVLAIAEMPSKLGIYYGFPVVLGFLWPLLDRLWQRKPVSGFRPEAAGFIAMSIIIAIVGATRNERHAVISSLNPEWTWMSGTREMAGWLETSQLKKGIFVDNSIASLAPWRISPQQILQIDTPPGAIKLLIYNPRFPLDKEHTEATINAADLSFEMQIPNSRLAVRSSTRIDPARLREALFE